ncbi:MAG: hypothetical protein DMD34_02830, partial [Gemmatimonadetes bacterium]
MAVSACGTAGAGGVGAGCVGLMRWRAAAILAFTLVHCSLICLHPEVAIINSAHISNVLRRM